MDRLSPLAAVPHSRFFLGLGFVVVLAVLLALSRFVDLPLAIWISAHRSAAMGAVFTQIQKFGQSEFYLVPALIVYLYAWDGARRGGNCVFACGFDRLKQGCLLLVVSLAVGGLIVLALKYGVARSRPMAYFERGVYSIGNWHRGRLYGSFPSSHTLTAFCVAFVLSRFWPAGRWVFFLIALAVACARLINLNHYLSDVLAAMVFAYAASTWIAPAIVRRLQRRRFSSLS